MSTRQDQPHHSDALAELSSEDVAQFLQENRCWRELETTAQQVTDLHYELTVVQKMGYQQAWEIVSGAIPSAGRTGRRRVLLDEPEPAGPSRDFRITDAHGVGSGGLHEKASANIAAIRLLKTLEAENREATDEEKAILVRYAGWGALAQSI